MAFDVDQLTAEIRVDTRDAERDLQRFSQKLEQIGRRDAAEAEWMMAQPCSACERAMAAGYCSQSLVLPSMLGKRKVTVPVGRSGMAEGS
jgi:hypothetical protein